jgi:transposase InsO family protein
MPWKETDVMDRRTEFVLRALCKELPFAALCREYDISRKTGYKWQERFLEEGLAGLRNRSRRPKSCPGQVTEDVACELVRLKLAHSTWGPKKIRDVFAGLHSERAAPSVSSVRRILDKAGLVQHRRRRRPRQCGRIVNRLKAQRPNHVWTVDFKGWWYSAEKERIEPLTVRDACSRYVLCAQVMENARSETVRQRFERTFATYGLPEIIRSDNGSPFACMSAPLGLSRLSAWWVALGIALDRIAPGHPEQNGGHERMHRDIAMEVEGAVDGDALAHQAALDEWRREFNNERPHEALAMQVPADLYVKSPRSFDDSAMELTYPNGYLRRKVGRRGGIKFSNHKFCISVAVAGWHVGLKPTGTRRYSVWFGPLCLGMLDLMTESFQAVREVSSSGAPPRAPGFNALGPKAGGAEEERDVA